MLHRRSSITSLAAVRMLSMIYYGGIICVDPCRHRLHHHEDEHRASQNGGDDNHNQQQQKALTTPHTFLDIPLDALCRIFAFFDLRFLARTCTLCKAFRNQAVDCVRELPELDIRWSCGNSLVQLVDKILALYPGWSGLRSFAAFGSQVSSALRESQLFPLYANQLETIIIDCQQLMDNEVSLFAQCPRLTSLSLARCSRLASRGLEAIAESCPQLTSLSLVACVGNINQGVAAIARNCKSLRHINLGQCIKIDDELVRTLGECASLQFLILDRCIKVRAQGCRWLGEGRCELRSLVLKSCYQMAGWGLVSLLRGAGQSLHTLDLMGCPLVDDDCMQAIGDLGGTLAYLDIVGCGVSEQGLEQLSRLPLLTRLLVARVAAMNDDSLHNIAVNCPRLRLLSLQGCQRVTDVGVFEILHACPKLHSIDLDYCINISPYPFTAYFRMLDRLRKVVDGDGDVEGDDKDNDNGDDDDVRDVLSDDGEEKYPRSSLQKKEKESGSGNNDSRSGSIDGPRPPVNARDVSYLVSSSKTSFLQSQSQSQSQSLSLSSSASASSSVKHSNFSSNLIAVNQIPASASSLLASFLNDDDAADDNDDLRGISTTTSHLNLPLGGYDYRWISRYVNNVSRKQHHPSSHPPPPPPNNSSQQQVLVSELRHLRLRMCNQLSVSTFEMIANECPYLQSVGVSGIFDEETTIRVVNLIKAIRPFCQVHW